MNFMNLSSALENRNSLMFQAFFDIMCKKKKITPKHHSFLSVWVLCVIFFLYTYMLSSSAGGGGDEADNVKNVVDQEFEDQQWEIIDSLFSEGMVTHQFDSFNNFCLFEIQKIVDNEPDVFVALEKSEDIYRISISDAEIGIPTLVENRESKPFTPQQSRLRDLTYDAPLYVTIRTQRCRRDDVTAGDLGLTPAETRRRATQSQQQMEDDGNANNNVTAFFPQSSSPRSSSDAAAEDTTTTPSSSSYSIEEFKRVAIARIPVMVGSVACNLHGFTPEELVEAGECEFDRGGYFIIKGKERVLIAQCRSEAYNTAFVLRTSINRYARSSSMKATVEMRSMSNETGHSVEVVIGLGEKCGQDVLEFFLPPYIDKWIPLAAVLRAMGCCDLDSVRRHIRLPTSHPSSAKYHRSIARSLQRFSSQEQAIQYLGSYSKPPLPAERQILFGRQLIMAELFPHMGVLATLEEKLVVLGGMIRKLLITQMKLRDFDDRDDYGTRRVDTAGILMEDLFRTLYRRFLKSAALQMSRQNRRPDVVSILCRKPTSITLGLRHSFSTGNWGARKNSYVMSGVSQVMSRLSFCATISHMRRLMLPSGKEGRNAKMCQIHPSQIGFVCLSETPEGETVGTVLNLAFTTRISIGTPDVVVRMLIETLAQRSGLPVYTTPMPMSSIEEEVLLSPLPGKEELLLYDRVYTILVRGNYVGWTTNPYRVKEVLDDAKRDDLLSKEVTIYIEENDKEVVILPERGRLLRPLFVVDRELGTLKWKAYSHHGTNFSQLIDLDVIRFVDCMEIELCCHVAMYPHEIRPHDHHYCELHPSMMLGVCSGAIPFPANSPSPRICYQSAMMKQGLSFFASNYQLRTDTVSYVLDYPQRAIVQTRPERILGLGDMPHGINAIVAVMCYTGRNQEDSVILGKGAVDRGMFSVTCYRTLTCEERRKTAYYQESIQLPPASVQRKGYNYSYLDPTTGIARKSAVLTKGDVVIGKVSQRSDRNGEPELKDCSIVIKAGEEGIVDRVHEVLTPFEYKLVKVVMRSSRIPEVGDKFCARSAQKGTCGYIMAQEDLPFTAQGITPDIIINSHCLSSRMTVGQLLECVLAKCCMVSGTSDFGDATPFCRTSTNIGQALCNKLSSLGFEGKGTETLTSGITGEMLEAQVFIGPTYYQRLKHMVVDKIHCFTEDHDILTEVGWVPIQRVALATSHTRKYRVLYCTGRNQLDYTYPSAVTVGMSYAGDLFDYSYMNVTSEHRMWISRNNGLYEFIYANDLAKWWYKRNNTEAAAAAAAVLDEKKNDRVTIAIGHLPGCTVSECVSRRIKEVLLRLSSSLNSAGNDDNVDARQELSVLVPPKEENSCFMELEVQKSSNAPLIIPCYHNRVHVYCVTVPGPGLICVRRRRDAAFPVWSGNSRATGTVTALTHQPLCGRSKAGGLRIGEMEKDAMVVHGISRFLKERLFDLSDPYQIPVCKLCGQISKSFTECPDCKNPDSVAMVNTPYAAKLLFTEFQAMGISLTIRPDE